ncbi:MAG TPA: sigma factor [Thermoleophilaceae bacterium]|nr:sigma factor [Thermoleophilaceae bacterium]
MAASARSPERRLVRDAQRGSAEALGVLFRRHWTGAYRAAWVVVRDAAAAEDIAQEAFIAAVRALDRFDRRRPFGPWLHRIVVNRAIDTARWTLWRPRAVHRPAWSPGEGFRVANLEGDALRVVAGDGTGDRLLRRQAAPVTPAWRPGRRHVLTYARPAGSTETVDVDTRRRVWARGTADRVTALAWSRDGERVVALTARGRSVFGRGGRRLVTMWVPGGRALALHRSGRRAAVAVERRGGTQVLAVRLAAGGRSRLIDGGPGRVRGMAWSPHGRRVLVGWADAEQWVLLGPGRRIRPMPGVSGELGAGAGFPRVAGWYCPGR